MFDIGVSQLATTGRGLEFDMDSGKSSNSDALQYLFWVSCILFEMFPQPNEMRCVLLTLSTTFCIPFIVTLVEERICKNCGGTSELVYLGVRVPSLSLF